ncbi:MAG: flippase-like domain-containing protein [Bacteroidetes bacterium]|nr:MAG: flippase-like domain-containing protein [Bacteroidota bacterium]
MKKRILTILQYVLFLGLGIFLAWWSLKGLDHEKRIEIKNALNHARYWLVIPVFCILILSHLVRALRWKLLINSLGYHPRTENTFFAVMIGYLTNQAVPRLGEILKCTLLARYEKVPADKLIGTIILERVIDAITLLTIFAITLAIQPSLYTDLINAFFHSPHDPQKKRIPGYVIAAIIIALIAIIMLLWMLIKKKNLADVFAIFQRIGKSVWQGISAVQHLKRRGLFLLYTLSLWSLYLVGGYIGFFALQETQQYGIKQAFAVLSAGSIGMIATPGGIGAYALLLKKTMELYGLQEGVALAFGWILWLVQTFVILIGGLFSFVAIPYFNKRKNTPETA